MPIYRCTDIIKNKKQVFQAPKFAALRKFPDVAQGTHFTGFTGTNVQILTPEYMRIFF
jgi:hypothetical protein